MVLSMCGVAEAGFGREIQRSCDIAARFYITLWMPHFVNYEAGP